VTSPSPEDGKTTVAANLGSVIAQGGRSVVIVDADLRRPRVHKLLQVSNRNGLSSQFIRDQEHLNGSIKPTEIEGLHVITSGHLPPNPSELLGSDRMSEILHELAGQFDTVIVDSPPLLMVTDALVLAPCVDGVLVVIKPSITKRAALKNMLEQLRQVNANVLGIVLNDIKVSRSRYYYYHYRGYYYKHKYNKDYGYLENSPEPSEKPEIPAVEVAVPASKFMNITKAAREGKNNLDFSEAKATAPEEPESLSKE
jgi:capsular exopolysaccharide synthesis family protein